MKKSMIAVALATLGVIGAVRAAQPASKPVSQPAADCCPGGACCDGGSCCGAK